MVAHALVAPMKHLPPTYEPVLLPGGARRLVLWLIGLSVSMAISVPLYLVTYPVVSVLVDMALGH